MKIEIEVYPNVPPPALSHPTDLPAIIFSPFFIIVKKKSDQSGYRVLFCK